MSVEIQTTSVFEKQAKRLMKKYPSLKKELQDLAQTLIENPDSGIPLGRNCYKIRIAIASKGKGKSGGARLITYFWVVKSTVYLLSIYDKSEQITLTNQELSELLDSIEQEL